MCDSHKNDKKSAKDSKGDEYVPKTVTVSYLDITKTRKTKILKALKEVEMIRSGKLPRESARDFLRESRNK